MLKSGHNRLVRRTSHPVKDFVKDITSPNGRVLCQVFLSSGCLSYKVFLDGQLVVGDSKLGFVLKGEKPMARHLALVRTHSKTFDETWETAWGEERKIRNHYHEMAFYLAEHKKDQRLFTLRFRVFDEGVAFRYEIPPQPKFRRLIVADELTEFNLNLNSRVWKIPAYQPDRYEYNYEQSQVHNLIAAVHTPLTTKTPTGVFVALHEAALYDYGSMTLKLNENNILKADITPLSDGMRAYIDLPFKTPWRMIMLADSALGLTTNRMMLNLNEPPKRDFSWVKPLKFMGIWWSMFVGEWTWAPGERHGMTTSHALEYIDACKRLGVKGLLVEGESKKPDFDLEQVAAYAKTHGIFLVGNHETVGRAYNYERQMENSYSHCASRNIHYIKPGYAASMMSFRNRQEYHHSQVGVNHYQKALEMAAKYHIMLDVHEPIKGTGIERTWPNMLAREGARSQEYEGGGLSPSHTCILPFTRLLAGGMDYTSGILDVTNPVKRVASTISRQLAYYVTIFSGMQMVADRPQVYDEHQEAFEFIREVPVSWDKTIPLIGEIGECYVVARKSRGHTDWYLGGVTNESPRRVKFDLGFLSDGEYQAKIYCDSDTAHYRDNQLGMVVRTRRVTKDDSLSVWMAAGGGFAIRFEKL